MSVTKSDQYLVVLGLLTDEFIGSTVLEDLKPSYFNDPSCRVIVSSIKSYHKKYKSIPSPVEVRSLCEKLTSSPGSICKFEDVIESLTSIYKYKGQVAQEYLITSIQEFIREVRTTNLLNHMIDDYEESGTIDTTSIGKSLLSITDYSLSKSASSNLGNISDYMKARKNTVGDGTKNIIVKSSIDTINRSLLYRGYNAGTLNVMVAPPSVGKSMFLVNEGLFASKQGFKVFHLFLGDMEEYDGFIRYYSCLSGVPQNTILDMDESQVESLLKTHDTRHYMERIDTEAFGSKELTINEIIGIINKNQKDKGTHYDLVIIDYADNIAIESTNSYEGHGYSYDAMKLFAKINRSVVLTASQPKIGNWKDDILPLESASESSRKQHIVDLLLTMNSPSRDSKLATIFMAKVRRGTSGNVIRMGLNYEVSRMHEISEDEFSKVRNEEAGWD